MKRYTVGLLPFLLLALDFIVFKQKATEFLFYSNSFNPNSEFAIEKISHIQGFYVTNSDGEQTLFSQFVMSTCRLVSMGNSSGIKLTLAKCQTKSKINCLRLTRLLDLSQFNTY